MPQWRITNTISTNEKLENFNKEEETLQKMEYKKKKDIFKQKYITEKFQQDVKVGKKGTEESVNEPEDETTDIAQIERKFSKHKKTVSE